MIRLDKYLADAGKGTRSEVRKLIASGRVKVDGRTIKDPGCRIAQEEALVLLDDVPVRYVSVEYYMLNKPRGVISAVRDEAGGQICVTDLITDRIRKDLFPVGRLDKDTEGLLLITNDGDLAHRLLSPKRHVDKTYQVVLDGPLTYDMITRLEAGVDIGDETPTLPCVIGQPEACTCRITIREGRYHQIRRMFAVCGREVTALRRLSMGPLVLDESLPAGAYRPLTEQERDQLFAAIGRR